MISNDRSHQWLLTWVRKFEQKKEYVHSLKVSFSKYLWITKKNEKFIEGITGHTILTKSSRLKSLLLYISIVNSLLSVHSPSVLSFSIMHVLLFNGWAVSDSLWPHGLQHARLPCFAISRSLLKLISIESVMPSNHLILPLLLPSSIFPSIRMFSNELALYIRWPKFWSFSLSIRPSNEYSELISFRIDWFDFLIVQGTLKNLLHHHKFKSTNSLGLSLLYGPTLTSIHDCWKKA